MWFFTTMGKGLSRTCLRNAVLRVRQEKVWASQLLSLTVTAGLTFSWLMTRSRSNSFAITGTARFQRSPCSQDWPTTRTVTPSLVWALTPATFKIAGGRRYLLTLWLIRNTNFSKTAKGHSTMSPIQLAWVLRPCRIPVGEQNGLITTMTDGLTFSWPRGT